MAGLNQYSELLLYLKQLAEADSYVNTVTKGDNVELDKMTVFPSVHIDINSGTFPSGGTIQFTVELSCWAIRDINKEVIEQIKDTKRKMKKKIPQTESENSQDES